MGYYTDYELTAEKWCGSNETRRLTEEELEKIAEEVEKLEVFESQSYNVWWGNAKWYESQSDMMLLSSRCTDVLFTLYGQGEDRDDEWYAYYLNGQEQLAPVEKSHDLFDCRLLGGCTVDHGQAYSYQSEPAQITKEPEPLSVDVSSII